ncbi:unnamed protein product [Lactuca saligna]|uniref:Uncharacterized protein n=1 Tax=Lactuca saligna TaxID=75948 RepID=A0AA35YNL7_LACSI|nr:unnamed protein product [Lactuca saligna]
MGACVSNHQKASPMKPQKSVDSTKITDHKVVIHPSFGSEKFPTMNGHVAVKPQLPHSQSPATISDFGSKEETFFDSQAWMDSDYEDEFMSVNGDFTPSRGNTPLHHISTIETKHSQLNTGTGTGTGTGTECSLTDHNESVGPTREPSPTPSDKKMRLLDLFKESVREDEEHGDDDNKEIGEPQKGDGLKSKSERHVIGLGSCFSNLLYVRGSERQKKKSLTSSVIVAGAPPSSDHQNHRRNPRTIRRRLRQRKKKRDLNHHRPPFFFLYVATTTTTLFLSLRCYQSPVGPSKPPPTTKISTSYVGSVISVCVVCLSSVTIGSFTVFISVFIDFGTLGSFVTGSIVPPLVGQVYSTPVCGETRMMMKRSSKMMPSSVYKL